MTANIPESSMQSAFVLRGPTLRAGIRHRRESRKGKRELERSAHPGLFAVKQSTGTYLKSHISIKADEFCAAVTEDHVFVNFSRKKFTVTAYFVMLLLTDIAITLRGSEHI